ncbi:MAG: sigma-70 family RNA polymerase sigma factor [Bacteroidia bacterium]|jgi:RNA polymerase sigma-70 factor (ECF subfamily)|nr:sigma-70 family RNA polymerase sigma factor [Bacteroidia bacterium]
MEVSLQMSEAGIHHQTTTQIEAEMALVKAAQDDPRLFEPLYRAYYKRIVNYVHHRVDDKETAFEITAQVFYEALNRLKRFKAQGVPFGAWLFRIAYIQVQQWYRTKKRQPIVRIGADGFTELRDHIEEQTSATLDADLYEALQQLNEEEMEIINLRFFEKRTFAEICEITGLGESACKMRVYRAIEKMKKHFNIH